MCRLHWAVCWDRCEESLSSGRTRLRRKIRWVPPILLVGGARTLPRADASMLQSRWHRARRGGHSSIPRHHVPQHMVRSAALRCAALQRCTQQFFASICTQQSYKVKVAGLRSPLVG